MELIDYTNKWVSGEILEDWAEITHLCSKKSI